jgi:tetratricopeptide (TPR) repeat protein
VPADQTAPAVTARTARLLAGEGRTDDVVKRFRLAMNEAMAGSVSDVGAVTAEIQAQYGGGKEAVEEAIVLFTDDRLNADAARANDRILVRLYRLADRPGDAADTLSRLVRTAGRDQERAQLLIEQAEMFQATGEPEQARAACEEALEYDGDNWIALNNLAYLLAEELGEWEEALPYAKRAVAISDVSQTLDTLGWTYVGLGQYPLAVAELSRAVRLDPGAAASYYHLGEAYRRWGQFDEAQRVLAEARALAEGDTMASLREQIDASLEKAAQGDRTL